MQTRLAALFLLCLCLTACAANSAGNDLPKAEESLTAFFQYLNDGDYQKAAELFGGSYESLESMNPLIPPEDREQLWQAGCSLNGLQCLPVLQVVNSEQTADNEYLFTVTFKKADGGILETGPCCGEDKNTEQTSSSFLYHVIKDKNRFLISDLPVYIP